LVRATEELGYAAEPADPWRAAGATLPAFLAVGFLPLAVYVHDVVADGSVRAPLLWSTALTAIAFIAVGGLKATFVEQRRWRSALETLLVGGAAAGLAYLVGTLLEGVA
jgi:VIT1/CCC1 family predicted Fe2+/Mn2+ transporter